jgi:hypothetical protein
LRIVSIEVWWNVKAYFQMDIVYRSCLGLEDASMYLGRFLFWSNVGYIDRSIRHTQWKKKMNE